MWDLSGSFVSWSLCLHSKGGYGSSAVLLRGVVGRMAVMEQELGFHDVPVHKRSLNVREQSLLQAVCLGPVWHPQIIALKIGG